MYKIEQGFDGEVFIQLINHFQCILHLFGDLDLFFGITAIVTKATIASIVFFSKIVQQELTAASGGFRVSHYLLHQLRTHFTLGHRLIAQEFLQLEHILIGIKCDATPFQAIPSGAPGFLIIVLDAFGHVEVNHKTYIRLVDPHPKSDGSHDDVHFFHQEIILGFGTGFGIQTSVIGCCFDVVDLEYLGNVFGGLPTLHVDDARLAGQTFDHLDDLAHGLLWFSFGAYLVIEVFAVKGRHKGVLVAQAQVFQDIRLYLGRSSSGQGDDWHFLTDPVQHRTNSAVFWAKIVSPFRDAMRFIHRNKRNVDGAEKFDVLVFGKGLGGNVKQLGIAVVDGLLYQLHLRFG